MKKFSVWLLVIGVCLIIGYWLFNVLTKPLPGEAIADGGREHVTDIAGINYTSDPPTSGTHFPVWAKPGVYDRLISDGYFIHSMEHGYVVIWYDCTKQVSSIQYLVSSAYAHDEPARESTDSGELLKHMKVLPQGNMSWFTPETQPDIEVPLPSEFSSDSCKNLVSKLSEFTKSAERVIVAPRVGMETPIVLTAWNRILKLSSVDQKAIKDFIRAFHNRGPEATTE